MTRNRFLARLAMFRRNKSRRLVSPSRRRRLLGESLENRMLLAGGAVLDGMLKVRFEYANSSGVVTGPLQVGQDYTLRTYVQDIRSSPTGVRNAYLTIDYNNVISVTGNATPSPLFSLDADGKGTSTVGKIIDAGGIDTDVTPPFPASTEELLFSIPIRAIAAGTLDLNITQESSLSARRPLFFDTGNTVPLSEVDLVSDTIEIVAAGVQLSRTSGLVTTEAGGTDTFTAVLTTQPTANVSFTVASNDTTEGTVSPQSITFTPASWNVAQTISVAGVNDSIDDDNIVYTIVTSNLTSTDSRFSNVVIPDVTVTNQDDTDTAGFVFSTTSIVTNENPASNTATFTIRLSSEPTSNVTVNLSSSNTPEATVAPVSLLFTPQNWNTVQTVTVTGVDDTVIDGPKNYNIVTTASVPSGGDAKYAALNPPDVGGVNNDNDVLTEVRLSRTSGLITSETGTSDTFTAVLSAQPTANVSFTLSSSNPLEGTVAPQTVTFTPSDWSVPKTVTVTGVNDSIDDDSVAFSIVTSNTTSTDTRYNNLVVADVSVTNQDDTDTAGYTVTPTSGLVTSENSTGNTATFTVRLNSQPTSVVNVDLTSSNISEGTVLPTRLIFNSTNWNTPQTVTVTGQNDDLVDGPVAYQIVTTVSTTDPKYTLINPPDVSVTNNDNDVRQVLVDRVTGLVTTEVGGTDTFKVRLSHQPTANVSFTLTSGNSSEVTVSPPSIVFTPANWNIEQTVTVTGVDDNGSDDGDKTLTIFTSATSSSDLNFNGLPVADVSVTNRDDDVADISVAPTSGLMTTEGGTSDSFIVVLRSRPSANVTIDLTTLETGEILVNKTSLVFTPANWQTGQTVTVTGIADDIIDGDKAFTIRTAQATSTDATYAAIDPPDVTGVNVDSNIAAVTVTPTTLATSESGSTANFTIALSSQPTSNVTINLTSADTSEGTVVPSVVTLTPANWKTGVTATVTGVNDDVADGPITYLITTSNTTSTDVAFNGLSVADVSVTNADDDVAGITVDPNSGLSTSESLQTATFQLRLNSQPTADVSIPLRTSDASEGTPSSASLLFTPANWNVFQTVTITGVNDAIDDGDVSFTIITDPALSDDPNYASQNADDVSVVNTDDNDTAEININASPNLTTTEEGAGQATFTVVLNSQPTADVVVPVTSNDLTEGTVSTPGLTFTPENWNVAQTVTVTGVDDAIDDGDVDYMIVLGSATSDDAKYAGLDPADIGVVNIDDDVPGFSVTPTVGLMTSESGSTATATIVLTQAPTADVVIGISSNDEGEGVADVASITFTPANWDTPQTITISGVADNRVDGDQSYRIVTAAAVSADLFYSGLNPPDLRATNADVDTATITITGPATVVEGNSGTTEVVFDVTLSAAVEGGFSLAFNTADGTATAISGDYTSQSNTLSFAGTANEVQSIRVQVAGDSIVELDETFQVALGELSGTLTGIQNRITVPTTPVTTTITNDDSATVTITAPSATNEGTGTTPTTFVFTVGLSAPVQGGFSVSYNTVNGTASSPSDFTATDGTLTFSNASTDSQTIQVSVTADSLIEADEIFSVMLGQITGLAVGLEGDVTIASPSATATILNDDTATLSISGPVATTEGTGDTPTAFVFTVTLSNDIVGGFNVAYSTNEGTATLADNDFAANSGTLAFAGTAGETKTITVNVNADNRVEPNETFAVALGAITGVSAELANALTIATGTATGTILNDDFARLLLADTSTSHVEGTSADGFTDFTFTVSLTDAISDADGFDVPVTINDGTATVAGGDYQDNDLVLHFDGNLPQTQTVTIRVRQDNLVEGDESFTVALGAITGLAAGETVNVPTESLTATITDDDTATLTISPTTISRAEGNSGTTTYLFDVALSNPVQGGFQIAYNTNDGTATSSDNDYVDNDGSLDFTSGLTKQITVQVNGDTKVEADESFTVALGAISGLSASLIQKVTVTGSPATATITSDDTATITITGPAATLEGSSTGTTALNFVVTLDHAVSSPFTLAYQTLDGTATIADNDYVPNNSSLSFSGIAGETKTIRVLVNQDSLIEADETLQVALGQLSGLNAAISQRVTISTTPVTATIRNDDSATVGFANTTTSALEADGTVNIAVKLSVSGGGALTEPLTVNVLVRDGGTATSNDFALLTSSVTFAAGSVDGAVQNVRVSLVQDSLVEDAPETIQLGLQLAGSASNSVSLGQSVNHTLSVVDDPKNGSLSGRVWVDADQNGVMTIGERTLPFVTIKLSGTTLSGEFITRQTTTDQNGLYLFTNLPAGMYSLNQIQPMDFVDGPLQVGTVNGLTQGIQSSNSFTGIVLGPSQAGSHYDFGEAGMHAAAVNRFHVLARPRSESLLGNEITAAMLTGNSISSTVAVDRAINGLFG